MEKESWKYIGLCTNCAERYGRDTSNDCSKVSYCRECEAFVVDQVAYPEEALRERAANIITTRAVSQPISSGSQTRIAAPEIRHRHPAGDPRAG